MAMPREQTQNRGQCTRTQRRRCGEQGLRLAQHKRCSGGVRVRPGIARALSQPVPIAALSRALTSARPVSLCRACLLRSGAACPRARAPRHALLPSEKRGATFLTQPDVDQSLCALTARALDLSSPPRTLPSFARRAEGTKTARRRERRGDARKKSSTGPSRVVSHRSTRLKPA